MTKNPPPKNSRWKLKETGELHVVIFSDSDEVVTIAAASSWLGDPDAFYEQFKQA